MIIGHQKQLDILKRSLEKNSVSQAYLFHGPESVGKFTVSLDFAKKLAGTKEDIYILKPEVVEKDGLVKKREIKIESIRELEHWLSLTSFGNGFKVAIIDDADWMTKASQNALLKTLEDPNEKVVVILVAQNKKKILPTVISRSAKIRFGTVADSEFEKIIPENSGNKKDIIFWSLGRPGLAFDFLKDEKKLKSVEESLKELKNIFSRNFCEKAALAEEMSKNYSQLSEKLNLWLVAFRESLIRGNIEIPADSQKKIELMEKIAKTASVLRDTNSNQKLILENLFLNF